MSRRRILLDNEDNETSAKAVVIEAHCSKDSSVFVHGSISWSPFCREDREKKKLLMETRKKGRKRKKKGKKEESE